MTNTMAFFMRCLSRTSWFALALLMFTLQLAGPARAAQAAREGIQIQFAELKLVDEVYQLNAQLTVAPGATLEAAVKKGITLNFITEFELYRPRWYWLDEEVARVTRNSRLSYNPLLRQYLLAAGAQQHSFDTLEDALAALGEISAWPVLDRRLLYRRYHYEASLSMRLDVSQLPKPLQINAISSRKWDLESAPFVWSLSL